MSHRGKDFLYSLSIMPSFSMKLTMSTSVIDGNLLVILKSNFSLKFNDGLDRFIKGANWQPQRVLHNLDVIEFTAGTMNSK